MVDDHSEAIDRALSPASFFALAIAPLSKELDNFYFSVKSSTHKQSVSGFGLKINFSFVSINSLANL